MFLKQVIMPLNGAKMPFSMFPKAAGQATRTVIGQIISLPLKYPLNTDMIATKNIAGDKATSVSSASGIASKEFEI